MVGGSPPSTMSTVLCGISIFIGFQYLLQSRNYLELEDQKMDLQAELLEKNQEIDKYRQELMGRERDLHRLTLHLKQVELKCPHSAKRRKADAVHEQIKGTGIGINNRTNLTPEIVVITPTYWRWTQRAELVRLSQTLSHVGGLHWIVVEDAAQPSESVRQVLSDCNVSFTQLAAPTPHNYKLNSSDPAWLKPKGIAQRNRALQWFRENLSSASSSVVYFADDDNTYSLRLFQEMRSIKRVGVWAVGLVGGLIVEKPLIDPQTELVTGWLVGWKPERPFPIDMAGFAISSHLLLKNQIQFSYEVPRGYQESHLLAQLNVTMGSLEPLGDLCRSVLVWHTRTETPKLVNEKVMDAQGKHSYDGMVVY